MKSQFPNRSDVRVHAITLGMCTAMIYAILLSTPNLLDRAGHIKGTDFLHFYALGAVALNGPTAALYDYSALTNLSVRLVPDSIGVSYLPIYGPQVSLLFAPFAMLPYLWAWLLWVAVTSLIYGLCCWASWRTCPNLQPEGGMVAILAAANPAFFNLVGHGQNSAIALACFTGAFFALKHKKPVLAGLAFGTLVYKPQLGLVVACVFILSREWKVVVGALFAAMLQLGLACAHYGTGVMAAYWRAARGIGEVRPLLDAKPYQMHSLFSFWRLLVPWEDVASALYVTTAIVVVLAAYRVWQTRAPLSVRYSFLLLATALASPHLNVYDLVIVAPALLMIGDWALGRPDQRLAGSIQRTLYFTYALPLIGPFTQLTHVQASTIAMSALCWAIGSIALRANALEHVQQLPALAP